VVALDIGWVSAATDGTIVDLAGVTDPVIAALPGGHTSKRVDAALVLSREPDVVFFSTSPAASTRVSLPAWRERAVRVRCRIGDSPGPISSPRISRPCAFLPLGARGAGYVLFDAHIRGTEMAAAVLFDLAARPALRARLGPVGRYDWQMRMAHEEI